MKRFLISLLILCLLVGSALAESTQSYVSLTNTQLGLTMPYPSGWTSNPGTSTICFLEPTTGGAASSRLAVTVKQVSDSLSAAQLEEQINSYASSISSLYGQFNVTELTTDSQFLNTRAGSLLYTADSNGTPMSGFVTMACIGKRIYAFHFSCPTDRFESMSGTIKELRDGITLLNAN